MHCKFARRSKARTNTVDKAYSWQSSCAMRSSHGPNWATTDLDHLVSHHTAFEEDLFFYRPKSSLGAHYTFIMLKRLDRCRFHWPSCLRRFRTLTPPTSSVFGNGTCFGKVNGGARLLCHHSYRTWLSGSGVTWRIAKVEFFALRVLYRQTVFRERHDVA